MRFIEILHQVERYGQTLRHLKAIQIYKRLWFKVYRPRPVIATLCPPLRGIASRWCSSPSRASSMLDPRQFVFLNEANCLPLIGGWNETKYTKLWLYNLHYFDDLNAVDASERLIWHVALIERWIQENPPAFGVGWEPYPTSLRIINWVKWLVTRGLSNDRLLNSLSVQVDVLQKKIEWHLLGNHLFVNAKALVMAGLFFECPNSNVWLNSGLKIIRKQLNEQILEDGGNFERSTMYHSIFLEDLLDLLNAAQVWPSLIPELDLALWRNTAARMLTWLTAMSHPDGDIALFNDAALCIAPTAAKLHDYAENLGITVDQPLAEVVPSLIHFAETGYIRLQAHRAVAYLDVAPIGPDYLPGHAHADTLSFELSVFGERVVVNGGTSQYGISLERTSERGTAAHSTVEVAGQNSSDVWGGFRVGRRAYPFDLKINEETSLLEVSCSHDGYKRCLAGGPIHRRTWSMDEDSLRVIDSVDGGSHVALARYILHPNLKVRELSEGQWNIELSNSHNITFVVLNGLSYLEESNYCPEFGKKYVTKCLVVRLTSGISDIKFHWS